MTPRTTLAAALLAFLVIGSFFLAERKPDVAETSAQTLQAGYYLEDVELRSTDGMGVIQYRLHAARADHDASDGSIALEQLRLDYGNGGNRWRFEAERGHMPGHESTIALTGNVRANSLDTEPAATTAFSSATLDLDIDAQIAATDDPVRVTFARGTLDGVGLDADLANDTFTVRSQVRGVFTPPPRQTGRDR